MAYRKTGMRKGGRRKGKRSAGAVSIAAVKRALTLTAERKYVDTYINMLDFITLGAADSWNYTIMPIDGAYNNAPGTMTHQVPRSAMQQGTGVQQRVGMKVKALYMNIRIECQMERVDGSSTGFVDQYPHGLLTKFAVVLDREPNGEATPLNSAIWSTGADGTYGVQSQRNHDYAQRFRVLKEGVMTMSPGVMCPCVVQMFVPLNGIQIEFGNTGNTFTDILKNSINIWRAQSTQPITATLAKSGTVRYYGTCRLVYVDA